MTRQDGVPTPGSDPATTPVPEPVAGGPGTALPQDEPTARQDGPAQRLPPGGGETVQLPTGTYGRGVRTASLLALVAGAVLVWAAFGTGAPDGWRSAMFGAGLVGASSAASVLVSAHMFRVAPAATAPALAALYLLKVLALGWLLVVPSAPSWLVPGAFLGWALAVHLVATACFVALTRRVSRQEAGLRERAADAGPGEAGVVGPGRHGGEKDPAPPAAGPQPAPDQGGRTP